MSQNESLITAYNNYYYVTMPTFNSSAIAGFPPEAQAVFSELTANISYIEDIAADLKMPPDRVFQILSQMESMGIVTHGDAVSGFSGMMISGSAKNTMSQESLGIGSLFSVDRIAPVLSSSEEIQRMGQAEDEVMSRQAAASVSPIMTASAPQIVNNAPEISVNVPPIVGTGEKSA